MSKRSHGEGSLIHRKGTDIWYGQYYRNGRQIRFSTGTAIKQEALAVLQNRMVDARAGKATPEDLKKLKYSELRRILLDNYVVKGNRSLRVQADTTETIDGLPQLDTFFGYKEVANNGTRRIERHGPSVIDITTETAEDFVRERKKQGAGPSMINRSLQCLRRMLNLARERGRMQTVPKIYLLKEPPARKGFLELETFNQLLVALPKYLRPLIMFLYWCGVRKGEALKIRWKQVHLENRTGPIIVLDEDQTKNKEGRVIPLPGVIVNVLEEIGPKADDEPVFDGTNLRMEWEKACAACGLGTRTEVEGKRLVRADRGEPRHVKNTWHRYNGLLVHDLRRSAVRNLRLAGVPETTAMAITGHKTREVFRRYNIVTADDVIDAMRRVETASLTAGSLRKRPAKIGSKRAILHSAKIVQSKPTKALKPA